MIHSAFRRRLIVAGAVVPFASFALGSRNAHASEPSFADIERAAGGRLGVCATDTATGAQIQYRGAERFPFCSTFKLMLSAAVLARSLTVPGLMQRRIHYTRREMVAYSPISSTHLANGMTVEALCAAAIQYSDNSAANQLLKLLGGPAAVTAYARSIGDTEFRLDRHETELNTAIPGDLRDTTTPVAMARSVQSLVVDQALPAAQREQLQTWLRGNTTGAKRIRAGVPANWQVGDKTGTGDQGTANDIGVLWPPARKPLVLAVYYTQQVADANANDTIIAAATRIAMKALA